MPSLAPDSYHISGCAVTSHFKMASKATIKECSLTLTLSDSSAINHQYCHPRRASFTPHMPNAQSTAYLTKLIESKNHHQGATNLQHSINNAHTLGMLSQHHHSHYNAIDRGRQIGYQGTSPTALSILSGQYNSNLPALLAETRQYLQNIKYTPPVQRVHRIPSLLTST